ncbi:MAG: hypothetical protein Ta2D_03930 [Rickettsiales bacterium]|nr:MAG: hypothetical protein Ta2D_03930 [Rickettsiales bacterium]
MTDKRDDLIGEGNVQEEIEKNKMKIKSSEFNALANVDPSATAPVDEVEETRNQNSTNNSFLEFLEELKELLVDSISQIDSTLKDGNVDDKNKEILKSERDSLELALQVNELDRKIELTKDPVEKDKIIEARLDTLDKKLDFDIKRAENLAKNSTDKTTQSISEVNIKTSNLYKNNIEIGKKIANLKKELSSATTEKEKLDIQDKMNAEKLKIEANAIKASQLVIDDIDKRLSQPSMSEGERKFLEKEKAFFEQVKKHNELRKEFIELNKQIDNEKDQQKKAELQAKLNKKQQEVYKQDQENFLKIVKERNNQLAKQSTASKNNETAKQSTAFVDKVSQQKDKPQQQQQSR